MKERKKHTEENIEVNRNDITDSMNERLNHMDENMDVNTREIDEPKGWNICRKISIRSGIFGKDTEEIPILFETYELTHSQSVSWKYNSTNDTVHAREMQCPDPYSRRKHDQSYPMLTEEKW
jgi:hypothetical protein